MLEIYRYSNMFHFGHTANNSVVCYLLEWKESMLNSETLTFLQGFSLPACIHEIMRSQTVLLYLLHVPIENTLSYHSVATQDPILVNIMVSIAIPPWPGHVIVSFLCSPVWVGQRAPDTHAQFCHDFSECNPQCEDGPKNFWKIVTCKCVRSF